VPRSVESYGATVEEAVSQALTELDVSPDEADIEVLHEAKRGLFGGGKRAHVRATLREEAPAAGEQTTGVADKPANRPDVTGGATAGAEITGSEITGPEAGSAEAGQEDGVATDTVPAVDQIQAEESLTPEERMQQLDREADMAADFIEGLLDMLDLPGDIEIEIQEEQALLNIEDVGSGLLIGRRGATLDALQELVRCAVQRQTERRSHVRVDVEGYRARQIDKLRDKCREAIAQVRETGEPVRLEPMDAYERKMMHDLVAKTGGVTSSSEGTEPKRRVVIHAAEG
jgi:spoIIIJ-associated protein